MKNEQEIFAICNNKSEMRDYCHQPFEVDGKVVASDGYIALIVAKELCDNDYSKNPKGKLPPAPYNSHEEMDCLMLSDLEAALAKCKTIPKTITVGKDVKCPECKGDGMVLWEYRDSGLCLHEDYFDCPICDGTGLIEHSREIETDEKIINPDAVISINRMPFRAEILNKAAQIMRLFGIEQLHFLTELNPNKSIQAARIADGITLLLCGFYLGYHQDDDIVAEITTSKYKQQ